MPPYMKGYITMNNNLRFAIDFVLGMFLAMILCIGDIAL